MKGDPAKKAKLDALVAGAKEAEADPERHLIEEAILATVAKAGPRDPFRFTFSQALLTGAIIFSRGDLAEVAEAIWSSVCHDGVAADEVLIRDKLKASAEKVEDAVLKGILDGSKAVDVTVAAEYIAKLTKLDRRRRAYAFGMDYLKAVEGAGDLDAAFANLSKQVFDLARGKRLVREYACEAEAAKGFLDELASRRADGRDYTGLDCGIPHLNEVLNGLGEGLYIMAGAPGTGKTTLAHQIADRVAGVENVPVLFFSYEQSAEDLRIKSLARLASVDNRAIRKGRTSGEEWERVKSKGEAHMAGAGRYLTIIEAGLKDNVETIRGAALMAKAKTDGKPILLVLDYLQIIPTPEGERLDGIKDKVDWNLSELRRLARDLKSPVLVISSENRDAYRTNKPPTLYALKESGGIEYSADAIIALWRNKDESKTMEAERASRRPNDPKAVRVEAHVLKNRNGELAKVKLNFTPAWATLLSEGRAETLNWADALGEE